MLKILYVLSLVYLQPFRRNSVLKCALHPKIAKNSLKTPILKVQGHSRLLKVIDVDTNRNLATIGC